MEVWIICDGEKTGPFQDFEIRRKISTLDVTADTPAWHEGLESWKPISELDIFRNEFDRKPVAQSEEETASEGAPKPPPLPEEPVYIRRFFARWFDLQIYITLWWLCLWLLNVRMIDVAGNAIAMMLQFVPWFALEAFLIHRFGTTPGKWLLGLSVRNIDHSPLTMSASIHRALRVLLAGMGLGWSPIFAFFCNGVSLFVAKRFGNALWDFSGGHRVLSEFPKTWRVITVAMGYALILPLKFMLLLPLIPQDQLDETYEKLPEFKEVFGKNPFLQKR